MLGATSSGKGWGPLPRGGGRLLASLRVPLGSTQYPVQAGSPSRRFRFFVSRPRPFRFGKTFIGHIDTERKKKNRKKITRFFSDLRGVISKAVL